MSIIISQHKCEKLAKFSLAIKIYFRKKLLIKNFYTTKNLEPYGEDNQQVDTAVV